MEKPALDILRSSLIEVNARFSFGQFAEPRAMERVADGLESSFGKGRAPDPEVIMRILGRFVRTGILSGYREIKCACYGFLVPIQGKTTLASSPERTQTLLGIVDRYRSDPKKLKRCFQALMASYLSLDGYHQESEFHRQWLALRQCLAAWLPQLEALREQPEWLEAILEHRNLLTDEPTSRYGAGILRGQSAEFESVCERLGIDVYSWVRRRVVFSAIESAASEGDEKFRSYLDQLIELLRANLGVRDEGTARLLNWYVQQVSTPEHMPLRMLAIEAFGNPLITANKSRWFEVSQEAREMVASWLKGFLIERFFELLSHDGRTDKRRPKFWIRHRGSIENMWFILGTSAMSNWNDDFRKLRETMGNQCLALEGATAGNNAFVMKIGKVYVVEFGEQGNSTRIFDAGSLPFDLSRRVMAIQNFRRATPLDRLIHRGDEWEARFSEALFRHGVYPDNGSFRGLQANNQASNLASSVRPIAPPGLKQFCNERGLRYDDRASGGRIVVYADSSNSVISGTLGQWGFAYDREYRRWTKSP